MKKTDEVPVSLSSLEEVKTIGKFLWVLHCQLMSIWFQVGVE
jgi:hypothetical protein